MTVINGLPAHALLVHLIVVLAPLTAVLAIISAVWPAARRRLVWLVLALALIVMVTTPLTTEAGEWLEQKVGESHWRPMPGSATRCCISRSPCSSQPPFWYFCICVNPEER